MTIDSRAMMPSVAAPGRFARYVFALVAFMIAPSAVLAAFVT
jgi:hypothetical protein